MGRRKPKTDFKRRPPRRKVSERIILVCEGEKTEPLYLRSMISSMDLPASVDVVYALGRGSAPINVVDQALEEVEKELRETGADRHQTTIYCVMDRDEHPTFDQAMDKLQKAASSRKFGKNISLRCVVSYPCFEIWFLYHFRKTRKPFVRQGDKSPCQTLLVDLKSISDFAKYTKGARSCFNLLRNKAEEAERNADFALKEAMATGEPNPSTQVVELVRYLRKIEQTYIAEKHACHSP